MHGPAGAWALLQGAGRGARLPDLEAVPAAVADVALLAWLGDLRGAAELSAVCAAGGKALSALEQLVAEIGRAEKASGAFFPRTCRADPTPRLLPRGVHLEQGTYKARDGTEIGLVHAWAAAPPEELCEGGSGGRTVVVRWGGNAELAAEVVRPGSPWEEMVASGLARLIAVDYRGFGWSGGAPSMAALRADVSDLLVALPAWHAARGLRWPPAPGRLVLLGRSLGAQAALHAAALLPPPLRAALVLDSPAVCHWPLEQVRAGCWEALSAALAEAGAPRLRPAGRRLERCACCRAPGARRAQPAREAAMLDAQDIVSGLDSELLLLVGTADELCPAPQIEDFFEASGAAPAKKRLVWLEGRGHNEVGLSREYWQRLAGFLDSVGGC